MPAEMGPFIGIVVNNVDTTRQGRLQVWIAQFGATNADGSPNLSDDTLWRTVSYCPPFYGSTPQYGTSAGYGTYPGNRNSYGMWFTPPDIGVQVLCFFVGGDPNHGYYVGCIPEDGINHMIPAIGSSAQYVTGNETQTKAFAETKLLPVTELNDFNPGVSNNPKFYTAPKPVQSVVAAILFQQGLDRDPIRGPIRSTSQRESPSNVYGISTPGKPIYQGGLNPKTIVKDLNAGTVKPSDIKVIGRQGGHTFVMDDGDLVGTDTLVRIRTAKGHQITMSDDGDCFYITHANGQTWIEFGKQGTVDVYASNSVNVRTQGTINLHADQNINMYAGGSIKMKAKNNLVLEGTGTVQLYSENTMALYCKSALTVRGDGTLALKGKQSSWDGGSSLNFKGGVINLNGAAVLPVPGVKSMQGYKLADTFFDQTTGWTPKAGSLETIVTRAPTHEPYPYHNKGVNVSTNLNSTGNTTSTGTSASTASATAKAATQSVNNPIQVEDYLAETPSNTSIGNINREEVTAMTSQAAKNADVDYQPYP